MAQATYITEPELLEAYDSRLIARLASDDGTPATLDATDANIANAIERASAQLESKALSGGRYTLALLAAEQAADNWILKGLVAALAMGLMYQRRGAIPEEFRGTWKMAQGQLKDLATGVRILGGETGDVGAGKVGIEVTTDQQNVELGLNAQISEFFPRGQQRIVN